LLNLNDTLGDQYNYKDSTDFKTLFTSGDTYILNAAVFEIADKYDISCIEKEEEVLLLHHIKTIITIWKRIVN